MWRPSPSQRQAFKDGFGVLLHKSKLQQSQFNGMISDVDETYGVLAGQLEICTGGVWRPAPPQSFAYFARRQPFGIRPAAGWRGPVEIVTLYFRAPADWPLGKTQLHLQLPPVWWRRYLDVEAEARHDAAGQRVVPLAAIVEFLSTLAGSRVARAAGMAAAPEATAAGPRRSDVQVEWMETWAQAEEWIHRHAGQGLSVADLARAVDVSPTQLRRVFHAVRGQSPKAVLTAWRIAAAQRLLASGDYSVTQIAKKVGYETIQRFSAAFRAATGHPPSGEKRGGRR